MPTAIAFLGVAFLLYFTFIADAHSHIWSVTRAGLAGVVKTKNKTVARTKAQTRTSSSEINELEIKSRM